MPTTRRKPNASAGDKRFDAAKLERVVAEARRAREARLRGYREQSLKIHPWVCVRCGREFTRETLHELTIHHKDHDHDNNPPDGSNWEHLCIYCHEAEHRKLLDHAQGAADFPEPAARRGATHRPFANLKTMLEAKKKRKKG